MLFIICYKYVKQKLYKLKNKIMNDEIEYKKEKIPIKGFLLGIATSVIVYLTLSIIF